MSAHRLWIESGASGRAIHLDHSSVDHKEDGDGEDMGAEAHKNALKPQAQQRTDAPVRQGRFQIADHAGNVDPRVGDDDAGALIDHALRHIEYRHDDVPGIGDDETAQKVLKIHFQKSQVSKSWRLFFSTMSWISS